MKRACRRMGILIVACLWSFAGGRGVPAPVPEDKAARDATTPFVRWTRRDEFAGNEAHDPLVVKDRVVVGTDRGELRAYRTTDGELLWIHHHGKRIYHRPGSDGERVYFTSETGVTAVAAFYGAKVWHNGLPACDGPVVVVPTQKRVYVGGHDGHLYAFDALTGRAIWTADFLSDAPPDPPGFAGARARLDGTRARPSALTADGDTLFLSVFDQCRLVAFDAKTGDRLWAVPTGGWVHGTAVANATHVCFGSQDKSFYCIERKTGKLAWRFATKFRIESGGAVDGQFVYFGSCDGGLYCVALADGKERWRFAADRGTEGRASPIYSDPILRPGGVFFAAGEGHAYLVDRDRGTLRWKIRPDDQGELYCSGATDGASFFVTPRPGLKGKGGAALVAIGLR